MAATRPKATLINGLDHLSTEQVARFLGIKRETVYAYVSRGVLTPIRIPGRRESYFPLAQVQLLARSGPTARRRPPALSEDVQTAITLIESDRLSYRGHDARQLAATATFEDVCALLWEHPAEFRCRPDIRLAVVDALARLPMGASVGERIRLVATVLAAGDVHRGDLGTPSVTRSVAELIMTSAVALGADAPATGSSATVAAAVARAAGSDAVDWVNQACILLADHDMAGSTLAARVAASVRSDPYAVITAALSAWESPLHGTASRRAYRLLAAAGEDPAQTIAECLSGDVPPPGFGHIVYTDMDPRAEFLIDRLAERGPHPMLIAAERLTDAVWRRHGLPRTIDLALALGSHVFGTGIDFGQLVFAHARMAGWAAHMLEEYQAPPLRFRLRGVYTGLRPVAGRAISGPGR